MIDSTLSLFVFILFLHQLVGATAVYYIALTFAFSTIFS